MGLHHHKSRRAVYEYISDCPGTNGLYDPHELPPDNPGTGTHYFCVDQRYSGLLMGVSA
ncbi:unnamed protein product [Choristocarpus tenellus]